MRSIILVDTRGKQSKDIQAAEDNNKVITRKLNQAKQSGTQETSKHRNKEHTTKRGHIAMSTDGPEEIALERPGSKAHLFPLIPPSHNLQDLSKSMEASNQA